MMSYFSKSAKETSHSLKQGSLERLWTHRHVSEQCEPQQLDVRAVLTPLIEPHHSVHPQLQPYIAALVMHSCMDHFRKVLPSHSCCGTTFSVSVN